MLQMLNDFWAAFELLLGLSPALMIPVFMLVSLISRGLSIRKRFPNWSNFFIGLICLVVGGLVSLLQEAEGVRAFIENGLILGSTSAITYQIFKGLLKGVKGLIEKKWLDFTGLEIDLSDKDNDFI